MGPRPLAGGTEVLPRATANRAARRPTSVLSVLAPGGWHWSLSRATASRAARRPTSVLLPAAGLAVSPACGNALPGFSALAHGCGAPRALARTSAQPCGAVRASACAAAQGCGAATATARAVRAIARAAAQGCGTGNEGRGAMLYYVCAGKSTVHGTKARSASVLWPLRAAQTLNSRAAQADAQSRPAHAPGTTRPPTLEPHVCGSGRNRRAPCRALI